MLKRAYCSIVHAIAKPLHCIGMLPAMERSSNPYIKYSASLFAIHDIDAMLRIGWPWWSLKSIDKIDAWLESHEADVFEYGAGASSVWLAKRAKSVTTIEHDTFWYDQMQPIVAACSNISLHLVPPKKVEDSAKIICSSAKLKGYEFEKYVQSIRQFNKKYDVIVIDGRARVACFNEAVKHLNQNGIIIWDDSQRARYKKTIKNSAAAFTREPYRGLKVALPYMGETTVFYHHDT